MDIVGVVGTVVAAVIGCAFVLIGLRLALTGAGDPTPAAADALRYARTFGLRDAFLGAMVLVLLAARERRALLLLLAASLVLPVADTLALAGPLGLAAAARANLPFEVPLALAAALLAARRPRGAGEAGAGPAARARRPDPRS
jgi:hypothetical protein